MPAAYFDCTDTSSEGYSPNEDDNCDLDMQFEISDYEPDEVNGIKPYQFEHDFETDSEPASEIDQDANNHHHYEMDDRDADRLHSLEWCDCRCCTILPTIAENRCCEELVRVRETRDDLPQQVRCITEHPGFRSVCLDIYVLLMAYYQYRVLHGEIPESPE
ncbi:uncharacterized protein LOC132552815 [Ylistrum balloti]|uniref:uncharacterized protein LOC132552815 n=1 Tax=Ylistrum balloti TaxID=509963 RepID=UPI002905DF6B|nr:uncharacterized protein LOC132552815 [Ylistrum balloti]